MHNELDNHGMHGKISFPQGVIRISCIPNLRLSDKGAKL
jgi:hypothetical protein